jgi:hypothetical protein
MPTRIIPFTPAATLFEPAEKRKSALTIQQTKRRRVSSLNESETRLWKVCATSFSSGSNLRVARSRRSHTHYIDAAGRLFLDLQQQLKAARVPFRFCQQCAVLSAREACCSIDPKLDTVKGGRAYYRERHHRKARSPIEQCTNRKITFSPEAFLFAFVGDSLVSKDL